MHVYFSQELKLNDSKETLISALICERIRLLIGSKKAACIENVFFGDTYLRSEIVRGEAAIGCTLAYNINYCLGNGNADLYFGSDVLYSLIRQTDEVFSFDDAMAEVSQALAEVDS